MARKNLTSRFVESVKVEVRQDFWDDVVRGLVLRVSPSGVKAWTVVYSRGGDGTKRRVTIGKYPAVSLEKARTKALAALSAIGEGDDPAAEKRARREAMTVEDLGALFIEKYAKRQKRSWAEDERHLKADVYPEIGKLKAAAVKKRDILDIIDAKADAGKLAASNHVLATVRKMFGWAVDNDHLETSPCVGIRPRGKAVRRDRVLSDEELRTVWNTLPDAAVSARMADIFRLLILTGQRSGEVAGMTRNEIDVEAATWTLPSSRTKNGLAHVVPLSAGALTIIKAAMTAADDELKAPLFSKVGTAIQSNAVAQGARLKLQVLEDAWTPHDLRRTVATGMANIGIAPHVVEAVLNHISGFRAGVAGTYNRALYDREKRQALDRWADHVAALVAGKISKITQLRRIAERA